MQQSLAEKTLVVIVGPTAVGKTAVAISLARKLGTEIISADSRQLYREMNIGTAKPTAAELAAAPHHFINTHSITEDYNAAQFGDDALALLHTLFQRHHTVILCGGSGLYVKALCEGFDDIPPVDETIRASLNTAFQREGLPWLQQELQRLDPHGYAALADPQNPVRLIRALEVMMGTGQSITTFQNGPRRQHHFAIQKIGLTLDREILYRRIDNRMDQMIAEGLFEEAEKLFPFRAYNALQTVGYREIFDYLEGHYDRAEAIRLLKRNSRRYAKRQLTWFTRDAAVQWCAPQEALQLY